MIVPPCPPRRFSRIRSRPNPVRANSPALVAQLAKLGADSFMTSALDEIGWLTNLRASDVDYNPVFLSHFLLCRGKPMLSSMKPGFRLI